MKSDKPDGLGAQVRALRNAAGLTQGELADRIGLTRTSVTNIEAGRQGLDVRTLNAIAKATGYELVLRFKRSGESRR